MVAEETDRRENKAADCSIYRVVNTLIYIVVEVKATTGRILSTSKQDNLAQLFLEAILSALFCGTEGCAAVAPSATEQSQQ